MHRESSPSIQKSAITAGIGSVMFSILTMAALMASNSPGGNYTPSQVTNYLAHGHQTAVIIAMHLGLVGLVGLVYLLVHLRQTLNEPTSTAFFGTGVAAVAAFAIGWGIDGGQVIAHLEGGSAIVIAPQVTYLISEIGVVFIFGCGAVLLGLALILLMAGSRGALPTWLRWFTVIAGVAGVAGLLFFPFFIVLIWGLVTGIWLIATARKTPDALHDPAPLARDAATYSEVSL